jgi:hypothetical protein
MKVHIHLGAHKTATTFIQAQLHDNRAALASAGYAVTGISQMRRQFTNSFDRLSWLDPVWFLATRPYLSKRLTALTGGARQGSTVVLSDENLSGLLSVNYLTGRLYPRAGARARMLDGIVGAREAHYFFCIRRYPDYLTSSWLQLASRGRAPSFEKYLARFHPVRPGWASVIADLARSIGPERLTVWTYDWFREDPARVFALLAPGAALDVPAEELRRDVLPSLTAKGLKAMTALKPCLSKAEFEAMGRLMRNFPFEEPNPRLEISDPALIDAYEQKYLKDLELIRSLGVCLYA